MKKLIFITLSFLFFIQINAQNWNEVIKAVASDRASGDEFGFSVSVHNNFAIIGAYHEDEDASGENTMEDAGSAYIFERDEGNNWIQTQKIIASDRAPNDRFGESVSISNDFAIVGAAFEDEDSTGGNTTEAAGSAYIFERGGDGVWNQAQKIVAADRSDHDNFGLSISINGNYAIIGAPLEDENWPNNEGAAYIFKRDENGIWMQMQKLISADRSIDDYFGWSTSIYGNYAIVGAVYNDVDTAGENYLFDAGSAYIFEKDESENWNQVQKIVASDRDADDEFGHAVSITNNWIIVGAPLEDDAGGGNYMLNAGSAYLFERNESGQWNQRQKITASDREPRDFFGLSTSISGKYVVVGAIGQDEDATGGNYMYEAGSAYLFEKDMTGNWTEAQEIVASDRGEDDKFGSSVAISGNYCIVGAPFEDEDANGGNTMINSGSTFIFELTTTAITETIFISASAVYPNPTSGKVSIYLGETYHEVDVIARNMLGQVTFNNNFGTTQMTNFEPGNTTGLYFIEIRTAEGKSAMLKVLKE